MKFTYSWVGYLGIGIPTTTLFIYGLFSENYIVAGLSLVAGIALSYGYKK